MKTETYFDAHGNMVDKVNAKFVKIIFYDDETGEAIRSQTIRL